MKRYKSKINQGHFHELMDRTSIALDYLDLSLGSHPVLEDHRKLKKLYYKAEEALNELYLLTGKVATEKE